MRRVAAILGTAAVVLMTASVFAQAPNFAGKWTVDAEKTAAAAPAGGGGGRGGGRGMGGGDMTITQDAKTLVLSRVVGENTMATTYNLDGSPSKNMGMGRGGGAGVETTSTAKWDGAKLVVTTTLANGTGTTVIAMDGDWMVHTTTNPGRDGGPGTPRATYYKKAQ